MTAAALLVAAAPAYTATPFFPWGNDLRMVSYYQTGTMVVRNTTGQRCTSVNSVAQPLWLAGGSVGISYQPLRSRITRSARFAVAWMRTAFA